MSHEKASGLEVFDGLVRRKTEPADSGVQTRGREPARAPDRSMAGVAKPMPRRQLAFHAPQDLDEQTPTRLWTPAAFGASGTPPPVETSSRPRFDVVSAPESSQLESKALAGLEADFRPRGSKRALIAVAVAVVCVVAALVWRPWAGSAVVTVAGPGGGALQGIEILVDGKKWCQASPCRIEELSRGPHLIRARAAGHAETTDRAVKVTWGETETVHIALAKVDDTGVRVSARGAGLKLWIDGTEKGLLPLDVTDLAPGSHRLRVGGNPRFEDLELEVSVESGKVKTVGPLQPKVLKGLITIKTGEGAEGARVLLGQRKVPALPATVEVPAERAIELVATKPDREPYRRMVDFDDGVAEKTFVITLPKPDASRGIVTPALKAAKARRAPTRARTPTADHPEGTSASNEVSEPKESDSPGAGAPATLSMNSIPVSNIILDGKPLGTTPKMGVQVSPGPHTVVFVHNEHGRKVISGTVAAGEKKTFVTQFP